LYIRVQYRHNTESVRIHAPLRGIRFKALEPHRQNIRRHFGAYAKDVARRLAIRHDDGSYYMTHDF
jgi:putative transposase